MIKMYLEYAKDKVVNYVKKSWKSDSIFDKGKIIFIGVLIFFLLWKIVYSIFN